MTQSSSGQGHLSDYISRNSRLLRRLIGNQIQSMSRLTDIELEEEARKEWGPLLIETCKGMRLLVEVDEGKSNIIIFDADPKEVAINNNIDRYEKVSLFEHGVCDDRFTSLLTQPIAQIEIISRPHEFAGWYLMCGVRLTLDNGCMLCMGTHLTDLKIPGVWLLLPEEVEVGLCYQKLGSIPD